MSLALKLKKKVLYSRAFRQLVGWAKLIVPPGFEGFSVYEISRFFFNAIFAGQITTRAAAIAFKLFVAFFPAIIVLLTLIPYVPIPDFQARLLETFEEMMPLEVFRFIEGQLHDLVVKKHGTLLSVSFLVGLYLASNSIDAILHGFSGSTNLTFWHSALKQRLLSLALLLGLTLLAVLAVPLLAFSGMVVNKLTAIDFFASQLEVFTFIAAKWVITILLVITAVSLLYYVGDPSTKRFRLFTPGALLTVLLILLVSQVLAFIFSNITDYNALYGSIGAILAVQLWIYVNMVVLLVGYELNISIARARVKRSERLQVLSSIIQE
ncbi:MAG: YihY/virulence factor BrkB family protein [Flavobacteriales bacterium]|nr:YihY/virulence factor BrkB family protein [Flavobacteriales bacterium]